MNHLNLSVGRKSLVFLCKSLVLFFIVFVWGYTLATFNVIRLETMYFVIALISFYIINIIVIRIFHNIFYKG